MYTAMDGGIPGISPAVAKEFISHDKGGKLPKKLGKKKSAKKKK
jgi:hypothetical protein